MNIMKLGKKLTSVLILAVVVALLFTACGNYSGTPNRIFRNIDNASIPDVLLTTVGTQGNVYFTSGISDQKDYQSFFTVTFEDTTEADYITLMEHYQSTSIGTDENDVLLFDWGWLQTTLADGSITINAYIQ